MKKKLIICFCLFLILLSFFGYEYYKYLKIYNKLKDIDGIGYKEKITKLENEYKQLLLNIDNLTEKEISEIDDVVLFNNELKNDYKNSLSEFETLSSKKNSLIEQKTVLNNQYQDFVEEERKRKTHLISNVSKINQYSIGYPTGCESSALTILLNYWGVNVSVADVVNVLPKGSKPYYKNGVKYGGNPYLEFIGNPSDYYSYGVYDIPIQNVGNSFKNGIINGRGMSFNDVLKLVKEDRPVVVWSTMNNGIPHYTNSWIYEPTGEKINWLADLHAITVVGYNDTQVITSDSLTGTFRYFNKSTFESRYNAFGKRALYY